MNSLKVVLLVLFAGIFLPWIYKFIKFLDLGETIFNHSPGPCQIVQNVDKGSEDMELIPGTSVVVMSTGFRSDKQQFIGRRGNMSFYDFKKPDQGAVPASFEGFTLDENFNPQGLSVRSNGRTVEVLVINHLPDADVVERFQVDPVRLVLIHLETIETGVINMNDLSATGERTFYFTQVVHYRPSTIMGTIEGFGLLRWSALYHFNGTTSNMLESGHFMLNGITQSLDKKYLYVVSSGDLQILVYEIKENDQVHLVQQKFLDTFVDNINIDTMNGNLWLAGHPVRWKTIIHLQNQETTTSPSQVLRIKTDKGLLTDDLKEVFVDSGEIITASTVAVIHNSNLLIGSMNNRVVHCQVKYIQ